MDLSDLDSPLYVLTRDGMSIADLETMLATSDVNGFPVVVSQQAPYLVGWVTRRDLVRALGEYAFRMGNMALHRVHASEITGANNSSRCASRLYQHLGVLWCVCDCFDCRTQQV